MSFVGLMLTDAQKLTCMLVFLCSLNILLLPMTAMMMLVPGSTRGKSSLTTMTFT
jgi:hypothetical protein